jgi:prevent-host-death family protein
MPTKPKERITATEARVHFGEVYRRVTENDETIIIERNGKPGAVILSIDAYEALGGNPPGTGWLEAARRSHEAFRPFFEQHPDYDIVEAIHEMREERDEQIHDAVFGR